MGVWQKWLGSQPNNPTRVSDHQMHPVVPRIGGHLLSLAPIFLERVSEHDSLNWIPLYGVGEFVLHFAGHD